MCPDSEKILSIENPLLSGIGDPAENLLCSQCGGDCWTCNCYEPEYEGDDNEVL